MTRLFQLFLMIGFTVSYTVSGASLVCSPALTQSVECCCGDEEEIDVPGGDFEFAPFPAPGGWIDYTSSAGPWDVFTGSVSHHDDGHNGLGNGNPNPSTAHMDLNGFSQGGICQEISGFTPGQECTIVFYYAIHNGISTGSAALQIDGGAALDITWDATNVGSSIWLEASYTFISTSTDMEVCFESLTSVGCCGMLIDDIQIFCCPPDEEGPELVEEPEDALYACLHEVPDPPDIEGSDDCTDNPIVTFDEELNDSNPCLITLTREWEVEDECGNTSMHTQLIEVADNEAPIVLSSPDDLYLDCTDDVDDIVNVWIETLGGADLFDNCEDIFITAFHDPIPADTCSETFVQFVVSDECGNFTEAEAFIFMEDILDPSFDTLPMDINIPCGGIQDSIIDAWLVANGFASISDNCTFDVSHNFSGVYDSTQLVTFMATDQCGNMSSAAAAIIISEDVDTFRYFETTCDPFDPTVVEILIEVENGCDSLKIFNYTLLPSDTAFVMSFTCNPTEAGVDTLRDINIHGCDSISYIEVFLLESDTISNIEFTCDPAAVLMDTIYEMNMAGCDSIVYNEVRLLASDTIMLSEATCDAGALEPDTLSDVNIAGCDSIIITTFYLTENDTVVNMNFSCDVEMEVMTSTIIQGTICDSVIIDVTIPLESHLIQLDSTSCLSANVGIDTTYETNAFGCDSIVITSVTYDPIEPVINFASSCKASETGSDTIYINTGICDSVIITNTSYEPIDPLILMVESCQAEDVGSDTTYVFTGICDSVIITNTSLLPGNESLVLEKTCELLVPTNDTVILQNIFGCDSLVVTEYFNDPMAFNVLGTFDPCLESANGMIEISNITGGATPYNYSLNNAPFQISENFTGLSAGSYFVQIMDGDGCLSGVEQITFEEETDLDISMPDVVTLVGGQSDPIQIDFSSPPDTFYWSQPSLISCEQCLTPSFNSDEELSLTLFAISPEGCIYERSIQLILEDVRYYIPNIFSPNGDGFNDEFKLFHSNPDTRVHAFRIFDRWGNLVFERTDFTADEDVSWDGRFGEKALNPDVFVYYFELESEIVRPDIIVGDITLIK